VEVGCGFTVIVKVIGLPRHVPKVGVTVIVLVIGAVVVFVAVKIGKLVMPLAANPIAALEFVHVKVAPSGVLAKVFAAILAPAQTAILDSAVTTGTGLTVTIVAAVQVTPPLVTVTVYVPLIAVVEVGRVGFCNVEVNPPGPLQL
jgi:hypothetical protein